MRKNINIEKKKENAVAKEKGKRSNVKYKILQKEISFTVPMYDNHLFPEISLLLVKVKYFPLFSFFFVLFDFMQPDQDTAITWRQDRD